jgi:hypothetical protein
LDDSDDVETATPVVEVANAEAASPPSLDTTANGRRKSGGRRKKMFLVSILHQCADVVLTRPQQSKETVLSEDEDTDAVSIDGVAVAAADTVSAFDALALGTSHSSASVRLLPRPTAPESPRLASGRPPHQP